MDQTALFNITYGLYVVGSKLDGKDCGCIVDAFIQSTVMPTPTVILCSIKNNQTNEAIMRSKEFTVSILSAEVDPFVIGNFGFQSGRAVDKWANVPHEHLEGLPILKDAVAYLRCRVTDQKELSTHTAFFCEVLDAFKGEGEPLVYMDYQKHLKDKAMAAFKQYKQTGEVPKLS